MIETLFRGAVLGSFFAVFVIFMIGFALGVASKKEEQKKRKKGKKKK